MARKIIHQTFSIDTLTKFEERVVRNQPWVSWGQDNIFVNGLYDLLDYSPIHNACVRSKIDNVVGQGFVNDYKVNNKETLNDIFREMVFDYIITGNIFLEVIWREDRSLGLAGLHYIPAKYMRVGLPDNAEMEISKFYYCRDWVLFKKAGVIEFNAFEPKNYTDRQIIQIRDRNPAYYAYGAPQYLAVINDIRLNHEITVYNLANLINGANPSLWVHFADGFPQSEQEERDILRRTEERYTGAQNAGKVIVSYSEGSEGKPDITQISSNLQQGFYQEVFELVQRQILSGHKIPDGSLIGLPAPTGFNSSAELLETAHRLFMKTSIEPIQKFLTRELKPIIELINPNEDINLEIQQNTVI
jgi:phage portal protein BeeE